jgi:carbonyl reductase 1
MSKLVYLVTGSNRGIGREVVKQIASKKPNAVVIVTSRIDGDAQKELEAINKEIGPGKAELVAHQLDVTNEESVKKCVEFVKSKYGGLDVLINNAGYAVAGSGFDEQIARTTSSVNYFGVKNVTRAFLPIVKANGRIITVSSGAGELGSSYSTSIKQRFMKEDLSLKELDGLAEEFFLAVGAGTSDQQGWPHSTYKVSKALVNGFMRNQHREASLSNDVRLKSIFWASLCPGWVQTRMAPKGTKTVEQGVDTPVWLATTDEKVPNGRFWRDRKEIDW